MINTLELSNLNTIKYRHKLNDTILPTTKRLYLGKELKDGTKYVKILNEFESDHFTNTQFKVGKNKSHRPLNLSDRAHSGGLTFTDEDSMKYFKKHVNIDGVTCRKVDFDDDEPVIKICDFDNKKRIWRCQYKASNIRLDKESICL